VDLVEISAGPLAAVCASITLMIAPLIVHRCSLVALVASLACSGSGETLIDGAVDTAPPDTVVDAGCDASWRREVLATGDVSVQNAITIDASGGIHIARYDRGTVTIVYTTNASGAWSSETVATLTDPGLPDPAIVVDSVGHVDVAHLDRRGRDVWFATRTSTWMSTPIETNTPGATSGRRPRRRGAGCLRSDHHRRRAPRHPRLDDVAGHNGGWNRRDRRRGGDRRPTGQNHGGLPSIVTASRDGRLGCVRGVFARPAAF